MFSSTDPVGKLNNLFIVADGMGGHKAGDLASKYTVETVVSYIKNCKGEGPITIVKNAVKVANQKLIEKAKESADYTGMGTTLVVGTIVNKSMYIANVGDSRLYILEDDELSQITRDHSFVEEMVDQGVMKRDDLEYKQNKNKITRAIGASLDLMADFFDIRLKPGNIVLMCSDGLTGMVSDEEIKAILLKDMSVKAKVELLIKTANDNGGKDNIGVVLIAI